MKLADKGFSFQISFIWNAINKSIAYSVWLGYQTKEIFLPQVSFVSEKIKTEPASSMQK